MVFNQMKSVNNMCVQGMFLLAFIRVFQVCFYWYLHVCSRYVFTGIYTRVPGMFLLVFTRVFQVCFYWNLHV
jgi:hypothetical protein